MSFTGLSFFVMGVLHPPAPQQPILKRAIPINNNPAIINNLSWAINACTAMAKPMTNLKALIKFQLLKIFCFIKANLNYNCSLFGNKGYK